MRRLSWFVVLAFALSCGGGGSGPSSADAVDVAADVAPDAPPQDPGAPDDAVADADVPPPLPDAAFFHATREHVGTMKDDPFQEDYATQYLSTDRLPDLDVRAIAVRDGVVWAGTASGLYRLDEAADRFVKSPAPLPAGAVTVLVRGEGLAGRVALVVHAEGQPDRAYVMQADGTGIGVYALGTTQTITRLVARGERLYAVADGGLFAIDPAQGTWEPVAGFDGSEVRDVAFQGDRVVVATAAGLLVDEKNVVTVLAAAHGTVADDDVRWLARDGDRVWCASATGLSALGTDNKAVVWVPGKGGLPAAAFTGLDVSGDVVLVGHPRGATAAPGGAKTFDHYVSGRWVPDDAVVGVALGPDGSRWLATPKGVSRIRLRPRTLAEKEAQVFQVMMDHFWRLDFLSAGAWVDDPWNPTTWTLGDHDNDGLWTQMGIGALCYAYAVTKDERYYQAARRAMDMMFLQIDVPAHDFVQAGLGRGFVTRSLVRDDEGDLFASKATQSNWHRVHHTDGHDYYWKDDTSSDETTGHFFGYPLFFDLCAKTDPERAAVADHAGALAGYIVDGGYTLRDLDGQPTSFGHFEPGRVAVAVDGFGPCFASGTDLELCGEAAFGGGWLNALEILGHLLSTWHMTGDPRFYRAYDDLVRTFRYDQVATFSADIMTVTDHHIANHSDHELAMLALHTLIRYEPDEARRQRWIDSLLGFYAYESGDAPNSGNERQPLWTAFVALATAGHAKVADGVRSLREYPADLRDWGVDNSHRLDAGRGWATDRFDEPQFDTVFPYDEIRTFWWNGNPYKITEGGSGQAMQGPVAFLLAYWAQRYAGILQ